MDELDRLIEAGLETLGVEFKGPILWTDPGTRGKVLKAVLAMTNKRDGGVLVIGLSPDEDSDRHVLDGLEEEEAGRFNTDEVAAFVNAYSNPNIDLRVERRLTEGHHIAAIIVREFADVPAVCARDYVVEGRVIVRRGKMYCRSRRMIESTEVQDVDDLRAILDLATEKGLERYFRLRKIERAAGADDASAFDRQLGEL
jgi:hypothetical protein